MSESKDVHFIKFGLTCGTYRAFDDDVAVEMHTKYEKWLQGEMPGSRQYSDVVKVEHSNTIEYIDFSAVTYVYAVRTEDTE